MKKPTRRLRATSDSGAARAETGRFVTPEHGDTGEPTGVASALFERIALRLHEARARVVRAVNNEMVLTYWHIGRELVEHMQGGDDRAGYGDELIESLSARLTEAFGRGFSTTNLRYFRNLFTAYRDRVPEIRHITSGDLATVDPAASGSVLGDLERAGQVAEASRGFSPLLAWSHYRALMTVESEPERLFYEIEAERERWSVPHLRRQIETRLFLRLLKSRDKAGVMALASQGQVAERPLDVLRDPYVLDFLSLPEAHSLRESDLEAALIENLQHFLLELGKGFAFIGRQKRISFEDQHYYVDLVFYHVVLKCYVLIDLKLGCLTHQDVGQMDGYVRLYDDLCRHEGDGPTVGLILCAEKNDAVARYSSLHDSEQLFAARYVTYLPTVEELQAELRRERARAEAMLAEGLAGAGRTGRWK
jgi:predicted nuclease of restriction endonuclease-like (RecB) superfamily